MLRGIHGILTEWEGGINLCLKTLVHFWLAQQAVEGVRQYARRRIRSRDNCKGAINRNLRQWRRRRLGTVLVVLHTRPKFSANADVGRKIPHQIVEQVTRERTVPDPLQRLLFSVVEELLHELRRKRNVAHVYTKPRTVSHHL